MKVVLEPEGRNLGQPLVPLLLNQAIHRMLDVRAVRGIPEKIGALFSDGLFLTRRRPNP